jgi:hypothetical protein
LVLSESEVGIMRWLMRWTVLTVVVGASVPLLLAADQPERVTWSGEIAGVLKKLDDRSLTIQVAIPDLQRAPANKNKNKNNNRGNNRGKKGNNNQPPRLRLNIEHKEVTLPIADTLAVRVAQPPGGFDEKGNIKPHTVKELAELKGPGNLPGYTALRDALAVGQTVKLYLAMPRAPAAANAKPQVVMALVIAQPQGPVKGQQRKK